MGSFLISTCQQTAMLTQHPAVLSTIRWRLCGRAIHRPAQPQPCSRMRLFEGQRLVMRGWLSPCSIFANGIRTMTRIRRRWRAGMTDSSHELGSAPAAFANGRNVYRRLMHVNAAESFAQHIHGALDEYRMTRGGSERLPGGGPWTPGFSGSCVSRPFR